MRITKFKIELLRLIFVYDFKNNSTFCVKLLSFAKFFIRKKTNKIIYVYSYKQLTSLVLALDKS